MERRVCHHRDKRFARDARGDCARLGRHETPDATRFAASGLHYRRNGTPRQRSANCGRDSVFDPLDFNGSEGIFFAPFGVQNEATLKSNSPDVGFRGAFLPAERSLRPDGFDAKWKISYYGRDYPQSWTSRTGNERFTTQAVSNSLFGAQFLSILDAYRYVERSIKYGVLFLVLVFTTFFLFEVTARQKIHPFQYLMVGAALCLFYLLLLSISEFIGFSWAYLIAAVASIALITWYCRFFLGGGVRTLMIGAGLTGVYTFLYITLRQQDYALLMGAIALFIVLAIVMYVTRKVDWYARDAS
jgi:inner membrane protein